MKKLTVLLSIMMVFSLTACAWHGPVGSSYNILFEDDEEWVTDYFEEISIAINDGDKEKFSSFFVPSVRESISEFDENVDELFEYINGSIVEYDELEYYTAQQSETGTLQKQVFAWTNFKTEDAEFSVAMRFNVFDSAGKKNMGIYFFRIVNMEDCDSEYGVGMTSDSAPGIHINPGKEYPQVNHD